MRLNYKKQVDMIRNFAEIICERFPVLTVKLRYLLVDYKLWCFNGEPYSFFICSERQEDGYHATVDCYDLEWNRYPENMLASPHMTVATKAIPRPSCLDEIIKAARILSKPFPEVRVDLYAVGGKAYFGELTFTSLGGLQDFYTPEYLLEMGEQVTIPGLEP